MIEQIEDLEDVRAADERNPLLEPHVHAVNRIANRIVARPNRERSLNGPGRCDR